MTDTINADDEPFDYDAAASRYLAAHKSVMTDVAQGIRNALSLTTRRK